MLFQNAAEKACDLEKSKGSPGQGCESVEDWESFMRQVMVLFVANSEPAVNAATKLNWVSNCIGLDWLLISCLMLVCQKGLLLWALQLVSFVSADEATALHLLRFAWKYCVKRHWHHWKLHFNLFARSVLIDCYPKLHIAYDVHACTSDCVCKMK